MSATPVSSANVSPKTPTKAHRLSVSKCCLICNVNLTANSSFYRTTYAGLSEKLEKLLRTSIEPRDRKYVCKSCFRRAELLIKKRNVLDSLDSEFQTKFLSRAGSDTLKRLSKESPQRPIKKARPTLTDREELPLRTTLFSSNQSHLQENSGCSPLICGKENEPQQVYANSEQKSGQLKVRL